MSYNLANLPADERRAMEDEKSELFAYWQQNLDRAKGEAARILGEKDRRKGKWSDWAAEQIEALQPEQYREMVRREVGR
ncbi:hypothetical protein [Pseudomonas citronellolis]|uniref:hypothetical protein n=1 Tax=Pseudomonas citronellolis TaxID=53408 RepID=UPI0007185F79|nr:hypothetical protein [Pseudomonas citronellolis]KRV72595.1 hypothetical protein AO742_18330 [Pseudomonas citronellolis]KRW77684.1 hypothetical protein AO738_03910 [Pseudomonas citronellolis]